MNGFQVAGKHAAPFGVQRSVHDAGFSEGTHVKQLRFIIQSLHSSI